MAASILAISLRWRSRALSSSARSVSEVARSAISACWAEFVLQVLQRLLGGAHDLVAPVQQLAAEIGPLALAHERLVLRWPIVVRNFLFRCPHENSCQTHSFRHWAKAPCSLDRLDRDRDPRRAATYLRKRVNKSSEQRRLTKIPLRSQPLRCGGIKSKSDYRRMTGH